MIVATLLLPAAIAGTPMAAEVEYAKQVTNKINQTGRTITMPVPLKDGTALLGDVVVRITTDDQVSVSKNDLIERLLPASSASVRSRLTGLGDTGGFVTLAATQAAGIELRFDSGLQELHMALAVEGRPTNEVSLKGQSAQSAAAMLSKPATFSGYVNVTAGLDTAWRGQGTTSDPTTSGRLELDSAVQLHGAVFENRAVYEGEVDANVCPTGAKCVYQHASGLKRQSSRVVYDVAEAQTRFQVGDTDPLAGALQRSIEMFGVSVEKSAGKLAPGENTGASGRTVLRLERPSDIDVTVNGATIQHLQLRPGTYNLRDLPLGTGANEVKLIITDDTGARRVEQFTAFSAYRQLGEGKNEWAITAGIPSYLRDNERVYEGGNAYAASSFLRYGLNDTLTGEANLQADNRVAMGSIGAIASTPWGVFGLQSAASTGTWGTGLAVDANYDLINFRGLMAERGESVHLGAEYRSREFHRPGDRFTTATGILYPEFNYWLRLSGSYSAPLGNGVGLSLSARYQFADDQQAILSPFTIKGDRYGADIALSRPLGPSTSMSFLAGYSNESYLRAVESLTSEAKGDLRFALRFNFRPDDKTTITTSYDSLNRQSSLSGYRSDGNGIGHWDTNVDVQQLGYTDTVNANAALGYYGNRGDVHVMYGSDMGGVGFSKFEPQTTTQRALIRASSALVFADGTVAVGAPVRSGSFAIIAPHESIAGKEITVGDVGNVRAKSDWLGPAVVTDLPSYSGSSIGIDVADLPVGYSLGTGAFDVRAAYKSGYALEAGSAYSVSVYGSLLDQRGEAVALVTGTAFAADQPAKRVAVFTNASGKFGADGLAPGRWIIEMATEGAPLRFAVNIPKGTEGLFKAGALSPIASDAP
ncbi:MAG: fimbrial biogenesis outer membrane usher protein [Hyphomicrobiaceae bacterium]